MQILERLQNINSVLSANSATLVVVSKGQAVERILEAYEAGQRDFGENRVQELVEKYERLPTDIRWHMIGHLQKNKVKYIAPFVAMIHSVDSMELLEVINNEARKHGRVIDCLLQIKIAQEETKYGLGVEGTQSIIETLTRGQNSVPPLQYVQIRGLMGMASLTDNQEQVRSEFRGLKKIFDEVKRQYYAQDSEFSILSIGMSSDWRIAVEEGSTMVRIGRLIFSQE